MKYQFIDKEKKAYPIKLMCKVLKVSRSSYYRWSKGSVGKKMSENKLLVPIVKEVHKKSKGTYGQRRIADALQKQGVPCGRRRAKTLMKMADVRVKQRKKFRVTTDSRHNLPVVPNLLNRQFEVSEPNKVWVSDITYIWTQQGWLYLAVIIDLFSRRVVGWALNQRITAHLVINAFRMAVFRRRPSSDLMFHSDRGSQYCSTAFQQELKKHNVICSMSRKGDCWDNAVAERFFGSLKREQVWFMNYLTREEAITDVVDYIEMFYNSNRSHSHLNYFSPAEFEKQFELLQIKNAA